MGRNGFWLVWEKAPASGVTEAFAGPGRWEEVGVGGMEPTILPPLYICAPYGDCIESLVMGGSVLDSDGDCVVKGREIVGSSC